MAYEYTFSEDTFMDPDGDVLSYSAALTTGPLPAFLKFDAELRKLYGTPGNNDLGQYDVMITASD